MEKFWCWLLCAWTICHCYTTLGIAWVVAFERSTQKAHLWQLLRCSTAVSANAWTLFTGSCQLRQLTHSAYSPKPVKVGLDQGGREAKLHPSFLSSCVLHRLTCNIHQATRRSIGIYIASAILYSDPSRTKLRSGISSPFLTGLDWRK
jgi:hypothetical protein